jgi:uncharacterized protein YjgD (DUF1641 family)
MKDKDINQQIADLNQKVDVLLEYVNQQRLSTQSVQDLINDFSIIGKDVYDSTVEELDKRQVHLKPEELTDLGVSFLRNINNFNVMMNSFESMVDLAKDLSPIVNESILDFTKMMAQFDEKGYFEFFKSMASLGDEFIQQFKPSDIEELKEKLPTIIQIMKQLMDDQNLKLMQNALNAVQNTDLENPPSAGPFQMLRALSDPSMKKSMGMMLSIGKNIYK